MGKAPASHLEWKYHLLRWNTLARVLAPKSVYTPVDTEHCYVLQYIFNIIN